jgi:hypothetical protein
MVLQATNTSAESLAWGFIYIQAVAAGHSEAELALFSAVLWGVSALAITPLSRPVNVRASMAVGLVMRAAAFVVAMGLAWMGALYIAAVMHGIFIAIFWVPYNAVFFRYTSDADRAGRSTALFALFAVAAATMPLVGVAVIGSASYAVALGAGAGLLLAGAAVVATADWGKPMELRLPRAFREGRALAPLAGLEGVWQGIFWLVMPLGTVRMTDQVSVYGGFLAFLGLMAGIASVLAGRWSDRARDRRVPLVIASVGVTVATLLVTFTFGELSLWSLAVGLTEFFTYMMMAFTFTIMAELMLGFDDAMGLREFMFNVGRTAGVAVVLAAIVLGGDLRAPLVVAAVCIPPMLWGYLRVLKSHARAAAPA